MHWLSPLVIRLNDHTQKHVNSFADHNEFSQIYGFIILPVAIAFVIYALRTFVRRCVRPCPHSTTVQTNSASDRRWCNAPLAWPTQFHAICTNTYSSAMLRARMPGPYEDRVGPVVLTILLVLSILVNMVLKFIDIFSAKRTLRWN